MNILKSVKNAVKSVRGFFASKSVSNRGDRFVTKGTLAAGMVAVMALTQAHADSPDAFVTITTIETAALTLIGVVISTGVIRVGWRIAKRYIGGL